MRDPRDYIAACPGMFYGQGQTSSLMTTCWSRRSAKMRCMKKVDPDDDLGLCPACLSELRNGRMARG